MRRSRTLPCFKVLAGLKGPSKSSVLSFTAAFTAAAMGVVSFPFTIEGPSLATGALKVNPAEGEKEGGLAAVVLTIGEENVKSGVEALGGSLSGTVSLTGVTAGILGEELVEVLSGGKGEGKLKVGNADVLMGSKMAGSSGTSATSSSRRLEEDRALVFPLFIFPPPELTLLTAGVLDRG